MRNWKITDANGNTMTFSAPSKTKAVQQYKRVFRTGKVVEVLDEGEARTGRKMSINLPGVPKDPKTIFSPVETVRKTDKRPGPNDPCECGSGKKFKKCCIRKKGKRR